MTNGLTMQALRRVFGSRLDSVKLSETTPGPTRLGLSLSDLDAVVREAVRLSDEAKTEAAARVLVEHEMDEDAAARHLAEGL